jgi:HEAT repeat protein
MFLLFSSRRHPEITFDAALRDLREPRWEARAHAATALSTCDPEDRDTAAAALRPLLSDPRGEVRLAAILSLAELHDRAALPPLIEALADPDRHVREAAAIALGRLGDAEGALPALCRALREGSPEVRFQAAASIAELDPAGAVPHLLEALRDQDPEVRGSAAAGLGEAPQDAPRAREIPDALAALLTDAHPDPRFEAACVLSRLGDRRAVPVLHGFLSDPRLALDAAEALARVPDERSAAPLLQLLSRWLTPPLIKVRAAYALARSGADRDRQGQAWLTRLSRSFRPEVRGLAQELLASL